MIVADVNLLAYYLLNGPFTAAAEAARERDKSWTAPVIWSHEFLNVLATNVRENLIDREAALKAWSHAQRIIQTSLESEPDPNEVLDLSVASSIATYDCMYVVMAQKIGAKLVTNDKRVLSTFKDVAMSIENFAAGK